MPIHSLFPLRLGGLAPFFQTFLAGLVVLSLSRLGLAIWHAEAVSAAQGLGQVFLSGLRVDVAVMSMWLGIPAALWLLLPASWSARGAVRAGFALWLAASLLVPFLLEVGTPPFMSEYGLRPNRLFIEYLVYPAVFRQELCNGFDPKQVERELIKRELLQTTQDGQKTRHQIKAREPGAKGTSWMFCLKPELLEWDSCHE